MQPGTALSAVAWAGSDHFGTEEIVLCNGSLQPKRISDLEFQSGHGSTRKGIKSPGPVDTTLLSRI